MGSMIHVEASLVIDARPEELYAVVADYHVGHPAILPRHYFTSLVIEAGGQGAGTVLRGSVKVLGQEYPFRQRVSEPEPGRVLVETDIESGQSTRFIFEPLNDGTQTHVTIASDFPASSGIIGLIDRLTRTLIARDIYRQELKQLADYMHRKRISEYVGKQTSI
jgi:hypothetical protein